MDNKQYAKNIIANWAAFLTYVVVGLVLSPFVVKSLGSVQYGLWTLIMSLTGYYGFLDLGIQGGVGHYVSRYLASRQFDRLNNIVNTALTLMCSIGALIVVISFAVSLYFTRFFNVDAADETSVRLALIIIGLSVAAKFPFGVFQAMLVSSARYDIVSGISVATRVSGAGAMIYSLTNGHGIVTLSLITAAMQTVEGLALLIMALRIVPQVRLRFFHFDKETFRESWNFGAFNFLINLFSQISTSLGPIVIGRMLDPVAVAHYSIGSNLLPYMASVVGSVSTPLMQIIIPMDVDNKLDNMRSLFLKGSRYLGGLILLITVNMLLIGPAFLAQWMGPEFLDRSPPGSSGDVLLVLVVANAIWLFPSVGGQILFGRRKHKAYAVIIIVDCLAKLILSVFLVGKMGMIGAAWGVLIPSVFSMAIALPWYASRLLEVSYWQFARVAILPNLAVGAAAFLAGRFLLERIHLGGWPGLFLSGAVVSLLHLTLAYFMMIEKDVKADLARIIGGKISALALMARGGK